MTVHLAVSHAPWMCEVCGRCTCPCCDQCWCHPPGLWWGETSEQAEEPWRMQQDWDDEVRLPSRLAMWHVRTHGVMP
jgi:hypothetical protein